MTDQISIARNAARRMRFNSTASEHYRSPRCSLLLRRRFLARGLLRRRFLRRRLLARHLAAFAPRLGQSDRDRLFLARHLLARAAALQRSLLPLVHRLLDFLASFLTVLRCHAHLLVQPEMCARR